MIRANPYRLQSAYGTGLFTGDMVILSSGVINVGAANSSVPLGVFAGCQYTASDGSVVFSKTWPASTVTLGSADAVAYVFDDPGIVYSVQVDTGSTYAKATHDGNVYDIELDHAGNTTTGQSGMELDLNDTSEGQWLVLGLIDQPDNAVGVNAKVAVKLAISLVQGS